MPAVAFIVGVHFFGVTRAMVSGSGGVFVWAGALMCISAASILLARAFAITSSAQTMAFTGFSCAIILWLSVLSTLM